MKRSELDTFCNQMDIALDYIKDLHSDTDLEALNRICYSLGIKEGNDIDLVDSCIWIKITESAKGIKGYFIDAIDSRTNSLGKIDLYYCNQVKNLLCRIDDLIKLYQEKSIRYYIGIYISLEQFRRIIRDRLPEPINTILGYGKKRPVQLPPKLQGEVLKYLNNAVAAGLLNQEYQWAVNDHISSAAYFVEKANEKCTDLKGKAGQYHDGKESHDKIIWAPFEQLWNLNGKLASRYHELIENGHSPKYKDRIDDIFR